MLEKFESKSETKLKKMIFDGIEVTTDLIFYIIYKYYKGHDVISELCQVSIHACRYVTDFGIELISYATNKSLVVENKKAIGCANLLKYKYHEVQLDFQPIDIFTSPLFNKLAHLNTPKSF